MRNMCVWKTVLNYNSCSVSVTFLSLHCEGNHTSLILLEL